MSEASLQRSVADLLRSLLEPPVLWTAVQPERRGAIEGARMKRKGVVAGWPDFLVLAPGPRVLGIELKAVHGRLSEAQKAVETAFGKCHARYAVCRSVDDVMEALDRARIPHRLVQAQGSNWGRKEL